MGRIPDSLHHCMYRSFQSRTKRVRCQESAIQLFNGTSIWLDSWNGLCQYHSFYDGKGPANWLEFVWLQYWLGGGSSCSSNNHFIDKSAICDKIECIFKPVLEYQICNQAKMVGLEHQYIQLLLSLQDDDG